MCFCRDSFRRVIVFLRYISPLSLYLHTCSILYAWGSHLLFLPASWPLFAEPISLYFRYGHRYAVYYAFQTMLCRFLHVLCASVHYLEQMLSVDHPFQVHFLDFGMISIRSAGSLVDTVGVLPCFRVCMCGNKCNTIHTYFLIQMGTAIEGERD